MPTPFKYNLRQCPGRWKLIQAHAEPFRHPLRTSIGVKRFWMLLLASSWPADNVCNFVGVARIDSETGEPDTCGETIGWTRGCFELSSSKPGWIEFCGVFGVDPMPQLPDFRSSINSVTPLVKGLPQKLA